MPNEKRPKSNTGANSGKGSWAGSNSVKWINPYLDSGDVEALESDSDYLPERICELLDSYGEEYTISSKFDSRSDRWTASIICNAQHSENAGLAVSVRAATRLDALYALSYVLAHKLPAVWDEGRDAAGSRFG